VAPVSRFALRSEILCLPVKASAAAELQTPRVGAGLRLRTTAGDDEHGNRQTGEEMSMGHELVSFQAMSDFLSRT
jgi:hypothetical protein